MSLDPELFGAGGDVVVAAAEDATRWAVVVDGVVENVVLWNGQRYDPETRRGWDPPGDAVPVPDDGDDLHPVAAGWGWDGRVFSPPADAPDGAPALADLIARVREARTTSAKLAALADVVQALADPGA